MIAAIVLVGCGKGDKKGSEGAKADGSKSGGGEPVYTIKIKFLPEIGKAVAIRETQNSGGSMKMSEGAKVLADTKHEQTRETAYLETLLEVADNVPKKFSRKYEKASLTQNGKTITRPYEGKTILFEQAGDGFKATAEGAKIDQATLKNLADDVINDDFKFERVLMPTKSVKLNEKWTIDAKTFDDVFGKKGEVDPSKSKGEAKLAKVYDKDGKQFGVIDYTLTLATREMAKAPLDPPVMVTMTGSMEAPIDGSSTAINTTLSGKAAGKTKMTVPGKKIDMEVDMQLSGRREHSIEMSGK